MTYRMNVQQCEKYYQTNLTTGLSEQEAEKRMIEHGLNELEEKKKRSVLSLFFKQWSDPMIIILLVGAAISMAVNEVMDGIIILSVIFINAWISVFQMLKAEKAMEELKKMVSVSCTVIRDGKKKTVESRKITLGDLVLLEEGDLVSFDGRIVEANLLKTDESSLTGESFPVEKKIDVISKEMQIQDQSNMVFSGTSILTGKAKVIVTAIGKNCAMGKIAGMIQEEEKTLLEIKLASLSKILGVLAILVCFALYLISLSQNRNLLDALMVSLSLAVATIPEGLPAVVTISLALGVHSMSKENAIIRHFHAIESLGCVSTICTDKTGTLTENKMTVQHDSATFLNNHAEECMRAMAICNNAVITSNAEIGDPTEIALLKWAKGVISNHGRRIKEIPFSSERRKMTVVYEENGLKTVYTKGAFEEILAGCDRILINNEIVPLNEMMRRKLEHKISSLTKEAYRVLAASRKLYSQQDVKLETGHIFLGYAAMSDPIKKGVKEAIRSCQKAKIKVIMITGDHPRTALAIARELRICASNQQVITGEKLKELSDEELKSRISGLSVFARVTPEDKQRIVKVLKSINEVVAMTGDGINDAPSLKSAHVGVAMASGTEVSKEASDLILLDNNFSTIVKAIEKGRTITENIRKAVFYLLSCNLAEVIAIFGATLFFPDLQVLFSPAQILWINVVTDAFPALALAQEPSEKAMMQQAPNQQNGHILSGFLWIELITYGLYMGIATLVAFRIGLNSNPLTAGTMGFLVLSMSQLFHSINCRSLKKSCLKFSWRSNFALTATFLFTMVLQIATVQFPFLSRILLTSWLSGKNWCIVLFLSMSVIGANEIGKMIFSKKG